MSSLRQDITALLNTGVRSLTPLHGGSVSSVVLAEMDDGRRIVVKHAPSFPDLFMKEAEGLAALRSSPDVRVPETIAVTDELLVMEFLETERANNGEAHARRCGEMLAALHRITGERFGGKEDNYIGATPQKNTPGSHSWKDFFVTHRLEPQFRLAEMDGHRDAELGMMMRKVEQAVERIVPDDDEPPRLLHGDLWSGNVLWLADGGTALIDPAVYHGHREADLGMTLLFGGFPRSFYDAYHEALPLQEEWRRRCDLYNLYHLFNHLHLFGDDYRPQIDATVRRLLR